MGGGLVPDAPVDDDVQDDLDARGVVVVNGDSTYEWACQ